MGSCRRLSVALIAFVPLTAAPALAGEPFHYPAGKLPSGAELKYVNDLPVLTVSGGPQEIGAAVGDLALKPDSRILSYTRDLLKADNVELTWPLFVAAGKGMLKHFPADYRTEMDALAKAAGADPDVVTVSNTFFDLKNTFECSALMVDPSRSATGGVLFGRNLDYPSMGYIHEHTLVTVYRPTGKHAFVSVGFPGLVGVLSGMNDAGLCSGRAGGLRREGRRAALQRPGRPLRASAIAGCWKNARPLRRRKSCWKACCARACSTWRWRTKRGRPFSR